MLQYTYMRWLTTACLVGLPMLSAGALAQSTRPHEHVHFDVVIEGTGSRPLQRRTWADAARAARAGGVSTTPNNQILVELAPEDVSTANLFDLNGRTLIFTPDGHGGYSRSVQSVAWDDDIGEPVADEAEISFQSFMFDFAGQRWGSFFVSRHGLITFGEPFTHDGSFRWLTMHEIAGQFVTSPTISPLHKPFYDATQHVSRRPERVVVTWVATEPRFYVHGVAPAQPARFQVVLDADGSVTFSYRDVTFGDGVVGLFANDEQLTKADLIVDIADPRDPELPGHVDLLNVAIYETNTDALILEFTLRDDVPDPPDGERYTYRVHFDMDEPFWSHPVDWSDEDFAWLVDVRPGDERTARAHERGSLQLLPSDAGNKVAVLAHMGRDDAVTSVAAFGAAGRWRNDTAVQLKNTRMADFDLIAAGRAEVDLSRSDSVFSSRQSEVFHYRGVAEDLTDIVACRVIKALGDEFDLFVFHSEFRIDSQESATGWRGVANVTGIGDPGGRPRTHPCSDGRVKGHWARPVWIKSIYVVNDGRDWRYRDEWGRFDLMNPLIFRFNVKLRRRPLGIPGVPAASFRTFPSMGEPGRRTNWEDGDTASNLVEKENVCAASLCSPSASDHSRCARLLHLATTTPRWPAR